MPELRLIRKTNLALVVCLCLAITAMAKHASKNSLPPVPKAIVNYDASRDPAKDLQDATAVAAKANKRILLEVGGDWCIYCNIMQQTFDSHPQLRKVRDTFYVSLKVNYSKENPNDAFLSHYPKIADYPQFFVLDSKGALLHSQPTHPFEHGKKYNVGKIDEFLRRWSQPPRHLFNLEKTS